METENINVETYCNTPLRNTKAFTFVELIVSVGIILLISTIGYMVYSGSLETKDNAKVSSDLATIDNSFKSYFSENKTLPEASGNLSFYKDDGSYAHDAGDSAYGVSSFVSEKTMPAKYLNSIPLDPRTKYYYAYGKTINNKYYEIAAVAKKDNNYKSIVAGSYKTIGDELGNLVREYNGPDFVSNNSTQHFPYNPEEKILTAQIDDYSGSVTIIHNGTTISDGTGILDTALVTGDIVKAATGSTASIYFSDGSKSYLGDKNTTSELNLTNMSYKQDSNLFTKIKLVLNVGTLWTAASKMSDNSNFEVDSSNTVAAVRGTIFGVSVDASQNTNVVLAQGKISVSKIDANGTISPFYVPSVTDSSGIISVTGSEAPKGIQVPRAGTTPSSSTGAINKIPGNQENINNVISGDTNISLSDYKIKLINVTNTGSISPSVFPYQNFQAKIRVDKKLLNHFTYFKLNDTYYKPFESSMNTGIYTFTCLTSFSGGYLQQILLKNSGKFELKACKLNKKGEEICSKSLNLKVPNGPFNYSPKCQNPKPTFGDEQVDDSLCDDGYELVGYAGYDSDSIDMLSDSNIFGTSAYLGTKISPLETLSGGLFFKSWKSSGILTILGLEYTGDASSMAEFDDISHSGFLNGSSFNGNGFFSNLGEQKVSGVFLDNNNNNGNIDFLKYDISPLSLSGSDFAIEMSVRGAALKRTDSSNTYYLFSIGGLSLDKFKSNLVLYNSGNSTTSIISSGRLLALNLIEDNKFYKVVAKVENGKGTLYIDGTNLTAIGANNIDLTNNNILYIGSSSSKENQWNDIIDYVKIYKR